MIDEEQAEYEKRVARIKGRILALDPAFDGAVEQTLDDLQDIERTLKAKLVLRETRERTEAAAAQIAPLLSGASVEDAFAMYMRYVPVAAIIEATGLPKAVIEEHAKRWRKERTEAHKDIIEGIKKKALAQLVDATGLSLAQIIRGLQGFDETLVREARPPRLDEIAVISQIFNKMHRAKITEEISDPDLQKQALTPQEMMKALGNDPYLLKAIEAHRNGEEVYEAEEEEEIGRTNEDSDSLAHPIRPRI